MRVQVIVGSELRFNVRRRNVPPKFDDHSLGHAGDVHEAIGFHQIEAIRTIVIKELSAKPSLRRRPAIIDAVHRRDAESPVHVIPLQGVRKALDTHYGLVEFELVGNYGVGLRNI